MIDCHVHTRRSHHGDGDLRDVIEVALVNRIRVLGFTEHAPLPFDPEHRLTLEETHTYLDDIRHLQQAFTNKITILAGLEVDYLPEHEDFVRRMLGELEYDYAYGAIHFFAAPGGPCTVWDFPRFQEEGVLEAYGVALRRAAQSGLFDGIVHPDLPLRAGVGNERMSHILEEALHDVPLCVSVEANASGITKDRYDSTTSCMIPGPSYPDIGLLTRLARPITIGSDAHSPNNVGKNIPELIAILLEKSISPVYHVRGRMNNYSISGDGPLG